MTPKEREVMELALEALAVGTFRSLKLQAKRTEIIERGLEALAQPEQEPVAVSELKRLADAIELRVETRAERMVIADKLRKLAYTTPPQPKEPEQEPVAWCVYCDGKFNLNIFQVKDVADYEKLRLEEKYPGAKRDVVPLYTTPPQRTWVGLTVEEITEIHKESFGENIGVATGLVEAKLKEKNT